MTLQTAALLGNVEVVQQHIRAGTDLDAKDEYGSTPLNVAVTFGKNEVAITLIEAGADLTTTNNEGSTPLHVAAFFGRTEIVKALLNAGADRSALNQTGHTALEIVSVPFQDVKPIYDAIGESLGPLGLILDYDRLEAVRPEIAELLR